MERVKFKPIRNVFKITDCENEDLKNKKVIIEISPLYSSLKSFNCNKYFYLLNDEILDENNEIIGYIKELK